METFRTRTGECRLTDTHLELVRTSPRPSLTELTTLGGRVGPAAWLALLGAGLLASGAWWLLLDEPEGVFDLLLATLLLGGAWLTRHDSAARAVPRAQIESVEVHAAVPPGTSAWLEVWFRDGGRRRRRTILLPLPGDGPDELDRARSVLVAAGHLPPG